MATNFPNDTSAAALADADLFLFADASDSYNAKEATWATMKAGLGYERTSAEVSAGIAAYSDSPAPSVGDIVSPEYAPGDIRRYGADTGAADNTAAIQAAVNQCSHGGPNPKAPIAGKFIHTDPIYYYYDAANNPGFMSYSAGSTDYRQGHIHFYGERPLTYGAWDNGQTEKGTQLSFEPASGTGDGHLVGNQTNGSHRGYQFHNITISGTTSGTLAYFHGSSHKCGTYNCTVFNAGTGGGLLFKDCWEIGVVDTYGRTNNASNAGYGLRIYNENTGAGNYNIRRSNFKAWQYAGEIGVYGAASGDGYFTVQTVVIDTCEFGGSSSIHSDDGLRIGQHTESLIIISPYFENCDNSLLKIDGQHSNIEIIGGVYGATYCTQSPVMLGTSGGGIYSNRQESTIISSGKFVGLGANLSYIERNVGADTGALTVAHCTASPSSATGTAFLEINGTGGQGVSLDANNLYGGTSFANEWTASGSGELDYYRSGNRQDGTRGTVLIHGARVNDRKEYTSASDVDNTYPVVTFDSTSGAFTAQVQDGVYQGQIVDFYLEVDGGNVSLDFATDSTAHSSIGTTGRTFDDAGDWLRAMWIGGSWRLIDHSGTTAYA